ncbi:MAG: 16S rRNA (cytidine(1402)-2'-O)-methyltransferase [Bacteroidetes bacterium]|nr:MAG: 16S rRNA (cytidine(1402)-2'-O)-methyltransferase [Bacteroidota bacterium]
MTHDTSDSADIPVTHGVLYIVSTPIGNLEDISLRALKVLSSVDIIAAEDTRKTGILLNHYNIHKPLVSYYSYNEERRIPELIEKLKSGNSIAVVSDAGTPGVSDPAFRLIKAAIDEDIPVAATPGPTAFLPALISSGLPIQPFLFEGFLPVKKGRQTKLQELAKEQRTVILYESPFRLLRTLQDIQTHFGNRKICIARELTKKFEEIITTSLSQAIKHYSAKSIKGEFVIIISTERM